VIPSGQPWLRSKPPVASGKDRLEMCSAALNDLPDALQEKVALTDIEIERHGPTYAIDTVNQLRAFFPGESFTLILGSDAAANFDSWHKAKQLGTLVDFLVVRRPGQERSAFAEIEIDALDISATQVRELLGSGQDASPFISDSVLTYIKERGLYGSK
jgi:nicotinate-nucleotide adenylyltransferase